MLSARGRIGLPVISTPGTPASNSAVHCQVATVTTFGTRYVQESDRCDEGGLLPTSEPNNSAISYADTGLHMRVLKVIKPIVILQSQSLCGKSTSLSVYYIVTTVRYPCVRQGHFAGLARGGVMPRLTKITTVAANNAADSSLDGCVPPASFSTEECIEVSFPSMRIIHTCSRRLLHCQAGCCKEIRVKEREPCQRPTVTGLQALQQSTACYADQAGPARMV